MIFLVFLGGVIYFNPRSPRGERLLLYAYMQNLILDFNPRSPRGERPVQSVWGLYPTLISIHALREESDLVHNDTTISCLISIHALLAESDRGGVFVL